MTSPSAGLALSRTRSKRGPTLASSSVDFKTSPELLPAVVKVATPSTVKPSEVTVPVTSMPVEVVASLELLSWNSVTAPSGAAIIMLSLFAVLRTVKFSARIRRFPVPDSCM